MNERMQDDPVRTEAPKPSEMAPGGGSMTPETDHQHHRQEDPAEGPDFEEDEEPAGHRAAGADPPSDDEF